MKPDIELPVRGSKEANGSISFCPVCLTSVGSLDPDPCLGLILGVSHACCGHGATGYRGVPYVVIGGSPNQHVMTIEDPITLEGPDALDWFAERGVGPTAGVWS